MYTKCSFLPLTRLFLISMSAENRGFRLWDQEILDQEAAARQAWLWAPQSDDSGRRGKVENEARPI